MQEDIQNEFHDIMKKECNEDYNCKLNIVDSEYLSTEQGAELGGILLYTSDRRIVCPNSLKNRLELCFEELLPEIRKQLFPVRN